MTYLPEKFVQTGTLSPHGGGSAPTGYLLCDGAAVSRTAYADLFAVISDSYGVGDGSTTFNVPDMQGNVPVGIGASGVTNRGDTGGEQEHTLSKAEMPPHSHSSGVTGSNETRWEADGGNSDGNETSRDKTGGGAAHNNMQPYVGTEYIIKT